MNVMHFFADGHAAPCGALPGSTDGDFTEDWDDVTCLDCRAATSRDATHAPPVHEPVGS